MYSGHEFPWATYCSGAIVSDSAVECRIHGTSCAQILSYVPCRSKTAAWRATCLTLHSYLTLNPGPIRTGNTVESQMHGSWCTPNVQHKVMYSASVSNQQSTVSLDFGRAWRIMCMAFNSVTSFNVSWLNPHII